MVNYCLSGFDPSGRNVLYPALYSKFENILETFPDTRNNFEQKLSEAMASLLPPWHFSGPNLKKSEPSLSELMAGAGKAIEVLENEMGALKKNSSLWNSACSTTTGLIQSLRKKIDEISLKQARSESTQHEELDTLRHRHRIEKGESLWKISQKYYGTWKKYPQIAELNGLEKEAKLSEGASLEIVFGLARKKEGQSWDELAEKYLGDKDHASFLQKINENSSIHIPKDSVIIPPLGNLSMETLISIEAKKVLSNLISTGNKLIEHRSRLITPPDQTTRIDEFELRRSIMNQIEEAMRKPPEISIFRKFSGGVKMSLSGLEESGPTL